MSTYTVHKGDTLSGIAARYHRTLAQVVRANPQIANPNLVHPGQVVTIPDANTSSAGGLQLPQFEWPRRVPGFRFTPRSLRLLDPPPSLTLGRPSQLIPITPRLFTHITFSYDYMRRMFLDPLPPNLSINLFGGPNSEESHQFLEQLHVGPTPQGPGLSMTGDGTIDVGSQVTTNFGNSVALEVYTSLVIHRSLLSRGRFDLFNQPTGTLTLGLGIDPTAWGTPTGYVGLSLSITALNWIMFGSREHPLFELGLGQLGFGAASNSGFSTQVGGGGELHLTDEFSILGAGFLNLSQSPGGVIAGPVFNFGLLRHF